MSARLIFLWAFLHVGKESRSRRIGVDIFRVPLSLCGSRNVCKELRITVLPSIDQQGQKPVCNSSRFLYGCDSLGKHLQIERSSERSTGSVSFLGLLLETRFFSYF